MFTERIQSRLAAQRQASLFRKALEIEQRKGKHLWVKGQPVLNFASNDYLGLAASESFREKIARNFQKYHPSSSSSRLVAGNYSILSQAEREYARYFGYKDALFFPSGYQANIGIISTFFEKGDTIVFDKHIHASSVKGIKLSGAAFKGYKHNNMDHLQKRLDGTRNGHCGVLTESIFSMDGDMLNMDAFRKLKGRYPFLSIVDEAHAFGALGSKGKGIARDVADIAVGTFGKALGLFGAFVLLPEHLKEYLFNFCSPLIYTTALPEAHAASCLDVLEMVSNADGLRAHLKEISRFMKRHLMEEGFHVSGDAHILSVEIGEEERAVKIAKGLLEKGIFVLPARFPTVPLHSAILRVSLTALHTEEDIRRFIHTLKEIAGKTE